MSAHDSSTAVTVKDIVLRLEGKVDALIEATAAATVKATIAESLGIDHEKRLRDLERWRYALPASVFAAIGAVAVAIFGQ